MRACTLDFVKLECLSAWWNTIRIYCHKILLFSSSNPAKWCLCYKFWRRTRSDHINRIVCRCKQTKSMPHFINNIKMNCCDFKKHFHTPKNTPLHNPLGNRRESESLNWNFPIISEDFVNDNRIFTDVGNFHHIKIDRIDFEMIWQPSPLVST